VFFFLVWVFCVGCWFLWGGFFFRNTDPSCVIFFSFARQLPSEAGTGFLLLVEVPEDALPSFC